MIVLSRTRKDNEDLARQEASLNAARALSLALHQVQAQLDEVVLLDRGAARARLLMVAETFEAATLEYAPALHPEPLRYAVELVGDVLLNFSHFVLKGPRRPREKEPLAPHGSSRMAWVQVADYVTYVTHALRDYRTGHRQPVLPRPPGWRFIEGTWQWELDPALPDSGLFS